MNKRPHGPGINGVCKILSNSCPVMPRCHVSLPISQVISLFDSRWAHRFRRSNMCKTSCPDRQRLTHSRV